MLPFFIKVFVLSFFEWTLKTDFTVFSHILGFKFDENKSRKVLIKYLWGMADEMVDLFGYTFALISFYLKLKHSYPSRWFTWIWEKSLYLLFMGLEVTKPVFGVSNKVRHKPVSSATETSYKIEILLVASLDMILSNKRKTKALIRLCGCIVWSVPLLFPNPEDRFSQVKAHISKCCLLCCLLHIKMFSSAHVWMF